jgi:hypothetical protein
MIKAVVERILGWTVYQDVPAVKEEDKEDWEPVYPFIETPLNYRYVWEALWNLRQRKKEKEDAESVQDKIKELLRLRDYRLNPRWKWFPEDISGARAVFGGRAQHLCPAPIVTAQMPQK